MNCDESMVSVITPMYNSYRFIRDTIESVINQTYENWEMIIVDDSSSDGSIQVVEDYSKVDERIRLFVNEVNLGAAVTRNKAIKLSKGKYIAFLDADDLWLPNKLDKQIAFMKVNGYSFSFTGYSLIDEKGGVIEKNNIMPSEVNYFKTITNNKIGCLTVIFDKTNFEDYMMPNIRKRQDLGLWLKLLRQCEIAYCIQENLALYRIRKGSISSNKLKLVKYHWELYRKIEKHSIVKSLYFVIYYSTVKFLRK